MKAFFHILIICSLILTIPVVSVAGIYKYRDAKGQLHFVDDESRIPAAFRAGKTSIAEAQDPEPDYGSQIGTKESADTPLLEQKISERTATKKKRRSHQTPVVIKGNRVLVPVDVAIGSRVAKLFLLLDTGATRTVLHRQSLAKLDLPSGKIHQARIAGGGTVNSEKIRFRHIKVGPFRIKKFSAMVIDFQGRQEPFDGMLGMDFLKTHPYQINFQKQIISWEAKD
jgi:predicted aspartyl protease